MTGRHVDVAKHLEVKERHPYARQAGPKFSSTRDLPPSGIPEDDGPYEQYPESDSDDFDDDEYNEYSVNTPETAPLQILLLSRIYAVQVYAGCAQALTKYQASSYV